MQSLKKTLFRHLFIFECEKNALYRNNWRIGQTKKEKMIKNLNRKWKWWCVMRWYDNINSIAYWYQWDEEESGGVFRTSEIEEESGGVFRTSEIHILTRGLVYSWKKKWIFRFSSWTQISKFVRGQNIQNWVLAILKLSLYNIIRFKLFFSRNVLLEC